MLLLRQFIEARCLKVVRAILQEVLAKGIIAEVKLSLVINLAGCNEEHSYDCHRDDGVL